MKTSCIQSLALAGLLSCACAPAWAEDVSVKLKGFEEVPAISTAANGSFSARINASAGTITFRLTWSDLQSEAAAAHIHFGQRGANGGVSVFLCGGGNMPACTATTSGTATGVIMANHVLGPAAQGIGAGEFAELVRAIRQGVAYVNVHSTTFPAGEIRGQFNAGNDQ